LLGGYKEKELLRIWGWVENKGGVIRTKWIVEIGSVKWKQSRRRKTVYECQRKQGTKKYVPTNGQEIRQGLITTDQINI